MKPSDRIPAWPEQSAAMRVSSACVLLQAILPEQLYMQVRKEVFDWDVRSEEKAGPVDMAAYMRAWRARKKA